MTPDENILSQEDDVLSRAIGVALNAHAKQYRHDGVTPYFHHLRDVASRVGDDIELQAIAWLHDVLEDGPDFTADTLRQRGMPEHLIDAVIALTRQKNESYDDFIHRVKKNTMAHKVKVADILSNLSDSPTPKQIVKYAKALLILFDDSLLTYG